jgi:predicted methyltransferase
MRARLITAAILTSISAFPATTAVATAPYHQQNAKKAIVAAIANPNRSPANVARDKYRHPKQTLLFFGITPTQTVVEFLPGGGWYTEILAPLLRDHGLYIGAQMPGDNFNKLKAKLEAQPDQYSKAQLLPWPAGDAIAPASVDTVLTFRNVHNLVMRDQSDATFAAFFVMLKPGGTLGIVDHRLPESRDSALEKTSGYLKISTVKALAEKAGFELVSSSEINANPKDTTDWEKGVWTLPPILRNGEVDRAKYLAIGESDRMTLRFRKPMGPRR